MRRWFLFYGLYMAGLAVAIALLLRDQPTSIKDLIAAIALLLHGDSSGFMDLIAHLSQAIKLLFYAAWLSVSMTFLPLPTGPVIAAVATQKVAISHNVVLTTLLVATIGAAASTIANVTDFHIFSLLLRQKRAGKIRNNRFSQKAEKWFARQPFQLLVIFNVLPIPVDVVRILAAMHQYPLKPFIAANFIGRWIRYAIIAVITFELGNKGWISVVTLLGIAVLMGLVKAVKYALTKLGTPKPSDGRKDSQ
jgi:membrane protein YqaA with SNARE-associated domain